MTFDSDAFISYAHLDNLPLIQGACGWVEDFHRALETRIAQLRGKEPQIWRDPKLQGNDFFADTLVERLRNVAVLVSIVSPPYLHSQWTRRELTEFCSAAAQRGGLQVGDKARLFKVLKTPVPLAEQPPELQRMLGYEFFKEDPNTGKPRELNRAFGKELELEFLMRLDDLAHEMCDLLECLEPDTEPQPDAAPAVAQLTVYLAETTSDLRDERDSIRRELQQHGYTVLPAFSLPVLEDELRTTIQGELERSQLSIHLVGQHFSLVPEGGVASLIEIQNDLAIERAAKGGFSQLIWIPPALRIDDERQRKLVDQLRMNPKLRQGSDLLELPFETFKSTVHDRLRAKQQSRSTEPVQAAKDLTHLYFIYDQRDQEAIRPWLQFLFQQQMEILTPVFEGSETEVRENHEDNLRSCDAVLIYYGAANECWLRRKMREVQKSPGYGRNEPLRAFAICLAPPKTFQKEIFQTHEASVVDQLNGFSADALLSFVRMAKGREGTQAAP
jgi:hypothetical protein